MKITRVVCYKAMVFLSMFEGWALSQQFKNAPSDFEVLKKTRPFPSKGPWITHFEGILVLLLRFKLP